MCDFFQFHIEIEGKCGWNIGAGRGQRVCWPPSQIIGGGGGGLPPSSYAYVVVCICTSSNPFAPIITVNKS